MDVGVALTPTILTRNERIRAPSPARAGEGETKAAHRAAFVGVRAFSPQPPLLRSWRPWREECPS